MFNDIYRNKEEEEEVVIFDADMQEEFEKECEELIADIMSDDDEISDEAFERFLNL